MSIITIVGARPQFVKAGTVSRALRSAGLKEVIVHTGQHFDYNMSQVFFDDMEIPKPDYNLEIHSLSHGAMTGRMLEAIEKVLVTEKPKVVLVYGDTNSTLAGALAAQKLGIPVAHVEAGLRSFNMAMPEETNRILTDRISTYLFCPTQVAVNNLKAEGFDNFGCNIHIVGDVMLDAALYYGERSAQKSKIVRALNLDPNFVLATMHRQENTDSPENLKGIIDALNTIHDERQVVVPLHPRAKKIIEGSGLKVNFTTVPPVGYFDMIELLKHCALVITDSGGLQKEAFFFKKGCVTIRAETEWTELVEGGFNILAGANPSQILTSYNQIMNKSQNFSVNLYGIGDASSRIADVLKTN
ncbi:MAG: UDP-N-acetylglucosamine 2-epimerase (non-hydrolyzing) [Tenuifilaceae bacterium]|nr:UDP-N-acetylglucosamine 2-epimerase (non-hydrolyzing) [Tenuifilaceae bacterium]